MSYSGSHTFPPYLYLQAREKEERFLRRQLNREKLEEKRKQKAAERTKSLKIGHQGIEFYFMPIFLAVLYYWMHFWQTSGSLLYSETMEI